ncbi:hypothetical protein EBQ74_07735 [bacterium]|nr:hypothetical protein [bacterium]
MEQHRLKSLCQFLCTFFALSVTSVANAITIHVADSPETNLSLALTAIKSAQKSLIMNAYELNSPEIAAALQKKIKSIPVTILLEGQPVGGMGEAGIQIKDLIVAAMNRSSLPHKFLVMSSDTLGVNARAGSALTMLSTSLSMEKLF